MFILKNLGHSVIGLDIDRVPLFGELLELFGVRRVVYKIDAFEPLPDLGQQFDWITAFSANFYLYHPAKETLGNGGMGFLSARFTASPGAGRKNLFWTQSLLQRRLLHA